MSHLMDEVTSRSIRTVILLVIELAFSGSVELVNVNFFLKLLSSVSVSAFVSVVAGTVHLPVPTHLRLVFNLVDLVVRFFGRGVR